MAELFTVDESDAEDLILCTATLMVSLEARGELVRFVPKFKKMFPKLKGKAAEFASLMLELWAKAADDESVMDDVVRGHWLRILAACIHAVLLANNVQFRIYQICAALGTD
jgi:hypothetical protein